MRRELTTYTLVFLALLLLLGLSVLTANAGLLVSLAIATAKVALIALFFMKLRHAGALDWAFATGALLLAAIGTVLMFSDFLFVR
jgi:caa(3)-type oxidase subunit IV